MRTVGRELERQVVRAQQGLEVDLVIPAVGGRLVLAEVKASRTPTPAMAGSLQRLAAAMPKPPDVSLLVHRDGRGSAPLTALAPGVRSALVADLVDAVVGPMQRRLTPRRRR